LAPGVGACCQTRCHRQRCLYDAIVAGLCSGFDAFDLFLSGFPSSSIIYNLTISRTSDMTQHVSNGCTAMQFTWRLRPVRSDCLRTALSAFKIHSSRSIDGSSYGAATPQPGRALVQSGCLRRRVRGSYWLGSWRMLRLPRGSCHTSNTTCM
jgi:hypothetical protein